MRWSARHLDAAFPAAFAAWAMAFLAPHPGPALLIVPVGFAVGGILVRNHPLPGALVVAAAQSLGLALGAPPDNASGLLAALCCLYLAGRRLRPEWGLGVLAVYVLVVAMTGLGTLRSLVGAGLFAGTWLLGQAVASASARVAERRLAAAELERRDHAILAAGVVERERARILTGSLDIVQAAVEGMRADALAAAEDLDPVRLERVGTHGEQAISDLRRVLGLLRGKAPREDPLDAPLHAFVEPHKPPALRWRGTWSVDAVTASVVALAGLVEAMTTGLAPIAITLTTLTPLGLALRRTTPLLAVACCAVPLGVGLATGQELSHGPSEMLTLAVLAWTVTGAMAGDARPAAGAALATALVGATSLSALAADSLAFGLVPVAVVAVTVVAGWSRIAMARAQHEADDLVIRAQEKIASRVEDAVTAERLRIARELHDITSHAVGAMALQARAARALAGHDRAAAHQAVANALLAGDQALAELTRLWNVLEEETDRIEPPEPGPGQPARPAVEELDTLVARLSGAGLDIELSGTLPRRAELALAVHRVVQEALTNAARHAPGARVRVRVEQAPNLVEVEVTDDGGSSTATRGAGTGFGLAGLTERLRLLGGDLAAGPHGAGFRVAARIPVPDAGLALEETSTNAPAPVPLTDDVRTTT